MTSSKRVKKLVQMAMLTAIGVLLYKIEIPMIGHLKIDPALIPSLVGGIIISPIAGIVIEIVKNIIDVALWGSSSAGIGQCINAIVGISVIVPFTMIYKNKDIKNLVIACVVTFISIITIGCVCNYFLTTPYFRVLGLDDPSHEVIMGFVVSSLTLNTTKFFVTVPITVAITKALKKAKVY